MQQIYQVQKPPTLRLQTEVKPHGGYDGRGDGAEERTAEGGNNTTKDNASENFFCDVCSKKLNGPIPYKMHLNSKAHKEEVALREEFGY